MRKRPPAAPLAIWLSLGALFVYAAGLSGLVEFLIFGALIPVLFRYLYFAIIYRGLVSPRAATIVCLALSIPSASAIPLLALFRGADATLEPHWWVWLLPLTLGLGATLAVMLSMHPPREEGRPSPPPRAATG